MLHVGLWRVRERRPTVPKGRPVGVWNAKRSWGGGWGTGGCETGARRASVVVSGGLEAAGDKGSRAAEAGGVRLVGQLLGALEQLALPGEALDELRSTPLQPRPPRKFLGDAAPKKRLNAHLSARTQAQADAAKKADAEAAAEEPNPSKVRDRLLERKRREEEKAWKRLGVIPTRRVTWKGLVVDVDGTRGIGYYPKILRDLPKAPPK